MLSKKLVAPHILQPLLVVSCTNLTRKTAGVERVEVELSRTTSP